MRLEKGNEWGSVLDDSDVVRGLWFAEYASTQKSMRLRVVMGLLEAQGKTIAVSDYASVLEGSASVRNLTETEGGGYVMMFPSAGGGYL